MSEAFDLEPRQTAHAERTAAPQLTLLRGDRRWNLAPDASLTIGAHPGNAIALEDRFVSRFHARVHSHEGHWRVRDLGSTNGTFVDGLRVAEAELQPGARLRIGSSELRVEGEADPIAPQLPGLISRDPALGPALHLLRRAAPSLLPITILGESGTGKEVAARAVHDLSARAGGPFVPVNCGAISHELAEAELFGHERGAFTGAVTSSPGAFGAADGGTLFLDEVGDLPQPLQVKLLRALEAGEVKPVGAARPRAIDVRVVCATHRDLARAVAEGAFREDLYYRLRGVTVRLPALRERRRDVLPIAEHFLAQCPRRLQLSPDARAALLAYDWPGNVRELRHVVHLAALLAEGGLVRAVDLGLDAAARESAEPRAESLDLRGLTLARLEELAIRGAFARHGGQRRAMAAELGIARSSLLRKLDELGLRGGNES